jgi:glycosyltransferase involved in cell wall biosynthesis
MAVRCFEQQTYKNLELIIVDDGDEQIQLPPDSRIRYIHLDARATVGAKRNIGARAARGEIIAALDDDDWSSPHRIENQVERLAQSGKAVTGYNETIRYDEDTQRLYISAAAYPYHASGTSQCYLKSWWEKNPFPNISCGEDMEFSHVAIMSQQLTTEPLGGMIVARKHSTNTSLVTLQHLKEISKDASREISPEFFKALQVSSTIEYMTERHDCCPICLQIADAQRSVKPYHVRRQRILVAIESCYRDRDNGAQQAQRDTWIKDLTGYGIDYRFFLGRPTIAGDSDEVFLDVDDDYKSLSFKTQQICRWAIDHGYESLYKTDTDTLVNPRNLITSRFEQHDYMGSENEDYTPVAYRLRKGGHPGSRIQFASGGAGYWLSRKSMSAVSNSGDAICAMQAEDVFVAVALRFAGINPVWCGDMKWRPDSEWDDMTISFHLSSALRKKFEPKLMYEYYERAKCVR